MSRKTDDQKRSTISTQDKFKIYTWMLEKQKNNINYWSDVALAKAVKSEIEIDVTPGNMRGMRRLSGINLIKLDRKGVQIESIVSLSQKVSRIEHALQEIANKIGCSNIYLTEEKSC